MAARRKDEEHRVALSDCFRPGLAGGNRRGHGGIVTGFSAQDSSGGHALDLLVRVFLGGGEPLFPRLALMLGNGRFGQVPGVLQLGLKSRRTPWRLLHAKIAVLGFCGETDGQPDLADWRVRLVVSTGNWTAQTMNRSLDLAWVAECGPENMGGADARNAADIAAAWDFLRYVLRFHESGLLEREGRMREWFRHLDEWCALLRGRATGIRPRFIDSRTTPLLDAIVDRIPESDRKYNFLAMGSGFYDGPPQNSETWMAAPPPSVENAVPEIILRRLKERGTVSSRTRRQLYLEPGSCQGMARLEEELLRRNWELCLPVDRTARPERNIARRTLHAKFLAGGYKRSRGVLAPVWAYLGSGNLTRAGILHRAGPAGNLEAGVVLTEARMEQEELEKRLPVSLAPDLTILPGKNMLEAGEEMPAVLPWVAPDPPYVVYDPAVGGLRLPASREEAPPADTEDATCAITLLPVHGSTPLTWSAKDRCWLWRGKDIPLRVHLVSRNCETDIAVLLVMGVADDGSELLILPVASPVPYRDVDAVLRALKLLGYEEEADAEAEERGESLSEKSMTLLPGGDGYLPPETPVRDMMRLIEGIALAQCRMRPENWTIWCTHLFSTLFRFTGSGTVKAFQEAGINPLRVLLEDPFLPDHATGTSGKAQAERALLANILDRVEPLWKVAGARRLGMRPGGENAP